MNTKRPGEPGTAFWQRFPGPTVIPLIGLLYLGLIGRYRAFDLDNVWFLSFSHTFWVRHVQTDTFMLDRFPHGMGGVVAFGKVAAVIQGAVLSHLGWTLTSATRISIAFVLAALGFLAAMCRKLGCSAGFTICFIALVGLTEPFVEASQKTRYECFPVFFLAVALWLASRRSLAASMFLAALAVEVEPAAIEVPCTVFVALIAQLLARTPRPQWTLRALTPPILRMTAGALSAAAIYLFLHPHIFSLLHASSVKTVSSNFYPGGFAGEYYFHLKRHLPELLLLLAAFAIDLVRGRRLLFDWPALCLLTGFIVSSMLLWANPPYFAFLSPFVCFFIVQAFYSDRHLPWILLAIVLLTVPQYLYRYHFWASRHAGFSQREQQQIDDAITRAAVVIGKPPDQLEVLGNYNLWYAHPNRFTNLDYRVLNPVVLSHADLIVCFDKPIDPILDAHTNQEIPCRNLDQVSSRILETLNLHGNQVEVRTPLKQP